jgi:hypothetical protein
MNATLKPANQAMTDFFRWICDGGLDTKALIAWACWEAERKIADQGFELGDRCEQVRDILAEHLERFNRKPDPTINYRVIAQALLMQAGRWATGTSRMTALAFGSTVLQDELDE